MLALGKYKAEPGADRIVLSNEAGEVLSFAPGEGDRIREVVGFAVSISTFKVLPAKVCVSPFEVAFSKDSEACKLCREEEPTKGLTFEPDEGDILINLIDKAVVCVQDSNRISGPRTGVSQMEFPDPPFEGRG
jgi:hypothetical protein